MNRPGRLLNIGGLDVHVVVDGAGDADSSAVVLIGGLAGNWFEWDALASDLSRDRTVVRFDRPGFGYSAPSAEAPTSRGEADRIAAVLDALDVRGTVVIVGHSLGGFYAETFARRYPHRIAGLVLLDASVSAGPRGTIPRRWRISGARRAATVASRSGLQWLLGPAVARVLNQAGVAAHTTDWVRAIYRAPHYLRAALVEDAVFPDLAAEVAEARRSCPLPPVPVVVAAAHTGRRTPWGRVWLRTQRGFADMLGARVVVFRPAHHHVMIDQPHRLAELIRDMSPRPGDD